MIKSKNAEKKQNNKGLSEEAKRNAVGFFSLLLKVDMRINPQRYKSKKQKI